MEEQFGKVQEIARTTTLPTALPRLLARVQELTGGVEEATEALRSGGLARDAKVALWDELKVLAVTRALVAVWAGALLDVGVRIRLHVLSRHLFLASVAGAATAAPPATLQLGAEAQKRYLAGGDYLSASGVEPLAAQVRSAAADVVGPVGLASALTHAELCELLGAVRSRFEAAVGAIAPAGTAWGAFVVPAGVEASPPQPDSGEGAEALSAGDEDTLRALMHETASAAHSPAFGAALGEAVDARWARLELALRGAFGGADAAAAVPLAKLAAPLDRAGTALLADPASLAADVAGQPAVAALCADLFTRL